MIEVNSKDYSEQVIQNLCNLFTPQKLIEKSILHNILVAIKNDKVLLMEAVESLARSKGFNNVKLAASLTAIQFYDKLGYTNTQETKEDEYGLTYIMKKNL